MRRRPAGTLVLVAVVVLGLALRLWGIAFGLPHPLCRPDEEFIVAKALGFFSGDLNPHFFEWPSLYLYLVHGGLRLVYLAGRFPDAQAFVAWVTAAPSWLHLTLRLISAASGMLTLAVVYHLAARIGDRPTALAATFFLAVAFLAVREAHFGLVDSTLTLLIATTVLLLLRALDRPRNIRLMALAGAIAGAATSMKYNAGLLVVVALVTALLQARRSGWRPALLGLTVWILTAGLAAAAGTPYAVLDPGTFSRDFSAQVTRLTAGHGVAIANAWSRNLFFALSGGLGAPLLWAGVAGVPLTFRWDWHRGLVVWTFPLVYFATIGAGHTAFLRYSLPLVPFLCLGAAFAVRALAMSLSAPPRPAGYWLTAAAAILLALPSLVTAVTFDRLMARPDTRLIARDWLASQWTAGASLHQSGWPYAHAVVGPHRAGSAFQLLEFDPRRGRFMSGGQDVGEPEWIVVARSPLRVYTPVPFELERIVAERYVLAYRVTGTTGPESEAWYDRQDAFFLPYARMEYRSRPGPGLDVYRQRH